MGAPGRLIFVLWYRLRTELLAIHVRRLYEDT